MNTRVLGSKSSVYLQDPFLWIPQISYCRALPYRIDAEDACDENSNGKRE